MNNRYYVKPINNHINKIRTLRMRPLVVGYYLTPWYHSMHIHNQLSS